MRVLIRFTAVALLSMLPWQSWAAIEYTDEQSETIIQMVKTLEQRHYAKLTYNNDLSSQHLDAYIDSLDGAKIFFLATDIKEFEKYRTELDNNAEKGNLDAGYKIFSRFQSRLETRLEDLIENLTSDVKEMDFSIDEFYPLNTDGRVWASNAQELDERWRKTIKNQVLSLKLADKAGDEITPTLVKRYTNQLKRVKQYNSQDVFQIYANALTELYDPHTSYFSPRRSENFNINMSLSLEGIGAVLQLEDEYTRVSRLVAKGPADKQGDLRPSDKIIAVGQGVNGEMVDVVGWRLDEVVELIRGPKDSIVRLETIPAKSKSADSRKTITIVRNKVKLEEQSAQKQILDVPIDGENMTVGVIDIPAFYIDFEAMRRGDKDYKSTTRDVKKLLNELVEDGVDGIIIDLRNNGGGSLQEANELTGLFIEYGPTVQIRHSSRRVWRDGKRLRSHYYDGPLVVLINRLSASASEIFAGAIQDYDRGLIVGDQSFGKGTVQTLIPLPEGQLKITESKFYRISGESTQHRGVVPDIAFPSIYDPEQIGESALDHALNWDQINSVRHRRYQDLTTILPKVTGLFKRRSANNPDFVYLEEQVDLAQQVRAITELSLNQDTRIAKREAREGKALAIENKLRAAKGEELLASWDEHEEEEQEADSEADADSDANSDTAEAPEEAPDVLLSEAGYVLIDTMMLRQRRYADRK